MSTPDKGGGQVKPFSATLQEIGNGRLHARVSEQLNALNTAVRSTGKKGKVVITIEVAPVKKGGDDRALVATGSSTASIPEPENSKPTTVFFVDDEGNLNRDDPRQNQLPLVGLPGRTATA